MTDVSTNHINEKISFRTSLEAYDQEYTTNKKLVELVGGVPLVASIAVLGGGVSYLMGCMAFADHIPPTIQVMAAAGALAMGSYTASSLGPLTKDGAALVVSLGKDLRDSIKSIFGFSKENPDAFTDRAKKDLKNIDSVLTMMDEKGQKAYFVGKAGERGRVTDEKGMQKFVKNELGNKPYLRVESNGPDMSVIPFSGEKSIGAEVVIPEADFSAAMVNFEESFQAAQNREFAGALDEVDPNAHSGPKV
ncbi:hypothetical protein [Sulfitobacter sp. R18_1]|uniref:hypothetical protein n=1 Tax=Sulfitobacter sp. R18_1 TaxID=2821104 RepID=UPI001ADBAF54|nr:hypothetical protein [Sulfitobacter sp. R18_1]MBO9428308.1 hypothetical protein [Sulfitobacter sp. R18_1]